MATIAVAAGVIFSVITEVVDDFIEEYEIVDNIKYTIFGILASPLFDKRAIQQRPLKASSIT